jgi:hypothetical protein
VAPIAARFQGGTINAPFASMALREFTDDDGRVWQVWDITPEKMHPSTRAEDYLQGVLDGWLVFEATDGHGKARLYPIPGMWAEADEAELRAMLRRADPVREAAKRKSGPTRAASPEGGGGSPGSLSGDREVARSGTPSMDVRAFSYPGGRVWTVAERSAAEKSSGESRVVLRFSSGSRTLDLESFPGDWAHYPDEQLIDLLCIAFPRPTDQEQRDAAHHRRRGDTRRS